MGSTASQSCFSKGPDPTSQLETELRRLEEEAFKTANMSREMDNLLRFKVSVLVEMLAMEEKKTESMSVTLHNLKHELLHQGIDSNMIGDVWKSKSEYILAFCVPSLSIKFIIITVSRAEGSWRCQRTVPRRRNST